MPDRAAAGDPPAFRIDSASLREELLDGAAAAAWLEEPGRPAGLRVAVLRMLGRLEDAEREGRAVLERARRDRAGAGGEPGDDWPVVQALLRLAHVLQWQGRFGAASELFDEAVALAPGVRAVDPARALGFALQHRAKCSFEAGAPEPALADAVAALDLRRRCGATPEEVASSEQAVRVLRRAVGH